MQSFAQHCNFSTWNDFSSFLGRNKKWEGLISVFLFARVFTLNDSLPSLEEYCNRLSSSSSSFFFFSSTLPLLLFFTLLCSDVNRDVAFGYSPRYSGTSFYKEWPTPSYSKLFRERVETQRSKTWTYFNSRSIFFFMNKWIVSCIVQELNFYKNKKVVELYKTEETYVKLRNRKTDNYTIYNWKKPGRNMNQTFFIIFFALF